MLKICKNLLEIDGGEVLDKYVNDVERHVSLFKFDRAIVNGAWDLGEKQLVNRVYYVNSVMLLCKAPLKNMF